MHNGSGGLPGLEQRRVQRKFLCGRISRDKPASFVETAQACGVEKTDDEFVGVARMPPSSRRTEMLPDDPLVRPRSKRERPNLQMSSRMRASSLNVRSFDVSRSHDDARVLDRVLHTYPCFFHMRVQHL